MALDKFAKRLRRYLFHPKRETLDEFEEKQEAYSREDSLSFTIMRRRSCVSQMRISASQHSAVETRYPTVRSQPGNLRTSAPNFSRKSLRRYSHVGSEEINLPYPIPNMIDQPSDVPSIPPLRPISSHWDMESWVPSNKQIRAPSPTGNLESQSTIIEMLDYGSYGGHIWSEYENLGDAYEKPLSSTARCPAHGLGATEKTAKAESFVPMVVASSSDYGSIVDEALPSSLGSAQQLRMPTPCRQAALEGETARNEKLGRMKAGSAGHGLTELPSSMLSPCWTIIDASKSIDGFPRRGFGMPISGATPINSNEPLEHTPTTCKQSSSLDWTAILQTPDISCSGLETRMLSPMSHSHTTNPATAISQSSYTFNLPAESQDYELEDFSTISTESGGMQIKDLRFPLPPPSQQSRYNRLALPSIPRRNDCNRSFLAEDVERTPQIPRRSPKRPKPRQVEHITEASSNTIRSTKNFQSLQVITRDGAKPIEEPTIKTRNSKVTFSNLFGAYLESRGEIVEENDETWLDDIEKWWAEFGYSGIGCLIQGENGLKDRSCVKQTTKPRMSDGGFEIRKHGKHGASLGIKKAQAADDSKVQCSSMFGINLIDCSSLNDIRKSVLQQALQSQKVI